MQVHEKIKFIRNLKGWSQEEMADKLEMSLNGYGSIERGETDIPYSRLENIAKTMDVELTQLLGLTESTFFRLVDSDNNVISNKPNKQDQQDLIEQQKIIIDSKQEKIELLQQRINDLESMITLLKNSS
jgi:transcriptional regulator with XRE-family HTH domain